MSEQIVARSNEYQIQRESWYKPLFPEAQDQGDPFVMKIPEGRNEPFRYYVYVTDDGAVVDGMAFPVYGSNDLVTWTPLGRSLKVGRHSAHWAPCILPSPTDPEKYLMLYSCSRGFGEEAHVNHTLFVAESPTPHGPFITRRALRLPDSIDFAIDPDVFRGSDGKLRLSFAMDFVEGDRIGTGLAEVLIDEGVSQILSEPVSLARATSDWQVFHPERRMEWKNIPGIDWSQGHTVKWHCIEGPCTVFGRNKERITLYSGGCYENFYGVGILKEDGETLTDISPTPDKALLSPMPEHGIYAPGHCSCVEGPDGVVYVMFHARFGSLEATRQMALAPLLWDEKGNCYCPRL